MHTPRCVQPPLTRTHQRQTNKHTTHTHTSTSCGSAAPTVILGKQQVPLPASQTSSSDMALSKVGLASVSHKLPDAHNTTSYDAIVQSQITSQPASVGSHPHHKLSDARTKLGWRGGKKETTTIRHATNSRIRSDDTRPVHATTARQPQRKKRRDTRDREEREHTAARPAENRREKKSTQHKTTPQNTHEQHTHRNKTNTKSKPNQNKNAKQKAQRVRLEQCAMTEGNELAIGKQSAPHVDG